MPDFIFGKKTVPADQQGTPTLPNPDVTLGGGVGGQDFMFGSQSGGGSVYRYDTENDKTQLSSNGAVSAKPLPYKAIGWTPKGEAFYGTGITGWLRKFSANFFNPVTLFGSDLTTSPTDATKSVNVLEAAGAEMPSIALRPGEILNESQIKAKETAETAALKNIDATEWANIVKGDPGSVFRVMGAGLKTTALTALDLLNVPQEGIRKLAAFGLAQVTYEDYKKMYPSVDMTTVTNAFMNGSEMVYTNWLNAEKRNEYLRDVLSGETPAYAVEKYSNPMIELAGSVILDPMWFAPVPHLGGLSKADDLYKVATDVTDAMKVAGDVKDAAKAGDALTKLAEVSAKSMDDFATKKKLLDAPTNFFKKIFNTTSSSKVELTTERMKEIQGAIQTAVGGITAASSDAEKLAAAERIGQFYSTLVRADTGTILADRGSALLDIFNTPGIGRTMYSNIGMEYRTMLRKIVESEGGLPEMLKTINRLGMDAAKAHDYTPLVKHFTDLMEKAVEDMYPSVNDLEKASKAYKAAEAAGDVSKLSQGTKDMAKAFEDVGKTELRFNAVNNFLSQNLGYQKFNRFFSSIYMGMNPGYAIRNMVQNSVHIFADAGPVTGFKSLRYGISAFFGGKAFDNLAGNYMKEVAEWAKEDLAMTRYAAGIGIVGEKADLKATSKFMGVASREESIQGAVTWGSSYIKSMKNALAHGAIPDLTEAMAQGMSKEAADILVNAVRDNKGDVTKALKMFRDLKANGTIDAWQFMKIDSTLDRFMDEPALAGMGAEFKKIRATATSAEDFKIQAYKLLRDRAKEVAERTADEGWNIAKDEATAVAASQNMEKAVTMAEGAITPDAAKMSNSALALEQRGRLVYNSGVHELEGGINRAYGSQIKKETADAVNAAYKKTTEFGGMEVHATWSGIDDVTRAELKKNFGEAINVLPKESVLEQTKLFSDLAKTNSNLQELATKVEALAAKLKVIPPKLDVSDGLKFRNTLWEWYSRAGNDYYAKYSVKYQNELWAGVIEPLLKDIGVDSNKPGAVEQLIHDLGADGVVPQIEEAKTMLAHAQELVATPNYDIWKNTGSIRKTINEYMGGMTYKEVVGTINKSSTKVWIGDPLSEEGQKMIESGRQIIDSTQIGADGLRKKSPAELLGEAWRVDGSDAKEVMSKHIQTRFEKGLARAEEKANAATALRNAQTATAAELRKIGVTDVVQEGLVPKLVEAPERRVTDLVATKTVAETATSKTTMVDEKVIRDIEEDVAAKINTVNFYQKNVAKENQAIMTMFKPEDREAANKIIEQIKVTTDAAQKESLNAKLELLLTEQGPNSKMKLYNHFNKIEKLDDKVAKAGKTIEGYEAKIAKLKGTRILAGTEGVGLRPLTFTNGKDMKGVELVNDLDQKVAKATEDLQTLTTKSEENVTKWIEEAKTAAADRKEEINKLIDEANVNLQKKKVDTSKLLKQYDENRIDLVDRYRLYDPVMPSIDIVPAKNGDGTFLASISGIGVDGKPFKLTSTTPFKTATEGQAWAENIYEHIPLKTNPLGKRAIEQGAGQLAKKEGEQIAEAIAPKLSPIQTKFQQIVDKYGEGATESERVRNIIDLYTDVNPRTPDAFGKTITNTEDVGDALARMAVDTFGTAGEEQAPLSIIERLHLSQVKDEAGKDVRLMHGTPVPWEGEYKISNHNLSDTGFYGEGVYFTPYSETATRYAEKESINMTAEELKNYAPNIKPAYVDLQNPFKTWDMQTVTRRFGDPHDSVSEAAAKMTERMKAQGYDGVIVYDPENKIREVVAFDPGQIIDSVAPNADEASRIDRLVWEKSEEGKAFLASQAEKKMYTGARTKKFTSPGGAGVPIEGAVKEPRVISQPAEAPAKTAKEFVPPEPERPPKALLEDADMADATDEIRNSTKAAPQSTQQQSIPRAIHEQLDNMIPVYKAEIERLAAHFGEKQTVAMTPAINEALNKWERESLDKIGEARITASRVANHARDFALLNYSDKRYADKALAYLFPYQYWYGRTYKNWMQRFVNNPKILEFYGQYRHALETAHAGMPDWWKYNLTSNDLLGLDSDNPMYFNLENLLNPLQGFVGVDFNDPAKRVNWWSTAIDDIGKFGPTLFTPLNWLVAGGLYAQGENDAATRWMGRLFPQSAMLTSVANKLGVKSPLPYNEVDPFVQFFSGGLDPYERRRVGRELGDMVDSGQITAEAAQEAAHQQSGTTWDEAAQLALGNRAGSYVTSFFGGTGMKFRNKTDMQIDEFYGEYYNLWNMKSNLSPDEFSEGMRQLRVKYPWMDVLLISRKPDDQRDGAYAYSVMSRIPPGQKTDLAKMTGIDDLLTLFYDAKGDFSTWNNQDKNRFMAGIADIGAILAIPDSATAEEYAQASAGYTKMNDAIAAQFGPNILDDIDKYYLIGTSEEKSGYLALHPEVQAAFQYRDQYILSNPMLNKYYGGISMLAQYYNSQMYATVDKEFPGIQDVWNTYDELQLADTKKASAFKKQHPELTAYTKRLAELRRENQLKVGKLSTMLPDVPQVPIRQDVNPSARQQTMISALQPEQQITWEQWQQLLSPSMQSLILDYVQNGTALPYAASSQLDYVAKQVGMTSGDDVLQAVMNAMYQAQSQQQ